MNHLYLDQFLKAFYQVWVEALENDKEKIITSFCNKTPRTDYMLGPSGVLSKVAKTLSKKIPIKYVTEWYKMDALFITGDAQDNLYGGNLLYPSKVHTYLEHENDGDVEKEMWKMLHFRSPLKVLIFYDWMEAEKTTESRKNWAKEKLDKLLDMIDRVDDFNIESNVTEYLFLLGSRNDINDIPTWKWASSSQTKYRPLQETGALDLASEIANEKQCSGEEIAQKVTITLKATQAFEETHALHGMLYNNISEIIDKIDLANKKTGATLELIDYSLSNVE